MIKRPSALDDDEDLIRMQNEYIKSKQKPAASVVRLSSQQKDIVTLKDDTSEDQNVNANQKPQKRRDRLSDLTQAAERLDQKDQEQHFTSVLKRIVERPIADNVMLNLQQFKGGFPSVPIIKADKVNKSKTGKKKSLFAQQFNKLDKKKDLGQENIPNQPKDQTADSQNVTKDEELPLDSLDEAASLNIVSCGDSIKTGIDEENRSKLDSMSKEEILEEQEKLLSTLDPKLVAFLKNRSAKRTEKTEQKKPNKSSLTAPKSVRIQVDETQVNDADITQKKTGNEDDPDPLNPFAEFDIQKDYVNMKDIEKDKLEWMKKVPKIELNQESITPRFDFEGNLLSPDQDTPTHLGLHHHGNDPGLPGYSLEELFQMIRSNFLQHRNIGLQTLSKIIEKYHKGTYIDNLSTDLLEICLNAGLVFILRWSLDEQTEQIYSASLAALANVLFIERDQEAIEKISYSEDGFRLPSLCTYYKKREEEMTKEEQEENRDPTDAELMERDIVKALIQMRILPRLRYLLDESPLSPVAFKHCLHILQRISQHNIETAYEIYKCPGMIHILMRALLENKDGQDSIYRLFRCLFIAGKNMAHNTISKQPTLIENMTAKFTIHSFGQNDKLFEEICKLWAVLLSYDLASNAVNDLYTVLLQHLQHACANYTDCKDTTIASLVVLVKHMIVSGQHKRVDWNLVEGVFTMVQFSLQKVLTDVKKVGKITHPMYLSALICCCTQYFASKNGMVNIIEPVAYLNDVGKFWSEHINDFIYSDFMKKLFLDASAHSDFKNSPKEDEDRTVKDLVNLPTYGSRCFLSQPSLPSLSRDSPVLILQALMGMLNELTSINKQLLTKVKTFVLSPNMTAMCSNFLEYNNYKRCSELVSTRIELLTLWHSLQLYQRVVSFCGMGSTNQQCNDIYLQIGYRLVSLLQPGDEQLAVTIMRTIAFNPKILQTKLYVILLSESCSTETTQKIENQLKSGHEFLQRTGSMYEANLFPNANDLLNDEKPCDSLLTASRANKILPSDWMFFPIVQLYNESLSLEFSGKVISRASSDAFRLLQDCLQYILLLEVTRPALLADVSETLRLTRLMCVFLTEGDLYSEETVRDLLTSLLAVYSSNAFLSYLNLEEKIPGITSFYDIYKSLIEQYLSASYGDSLFANVLLFPTQLCHDVKYRRILWTEHSSILRVFPTPLNKVVLNIKSFLASESENMEMIRLYYRTFIAKRLSKSWCPLFYVIAIHHLVQFIFNAQTSDETPKDETEEILKERRSMLNGILTLQDTELRDDVIYYKFYDVHSKQSWIERFTQLPPSREKFLRDLKS
ncbi:RNA polymerase II-associated protein 1-like [Clytia hemisphaerica]